MKLWIKIISAAIPAAALLLLSFLLIRRRRLRRRPLINPQIPETAAKSKFHLSYKSVNGASNSHRFHHLHHHQTPSSPFNWKEHPRLLSEAAESGWPRFAFSSSSIIRPSSSPLWVFCPACDGGIQREAAAAASGWDLPPGSSDFMQTVRLNAAPNKTSNEESFSFIRTSLPLPGPVLSGAGSFPQEAYFEITILYLQPPKKLQENRETDRSKLNPKEPASRTEENRDLNVSVGLTNRASMSNQFMPGTFPGSIGFNSNGSVYLDGRKLVFESEKAEWADVNRVIGCGFAPRKKKVFFTVDSQLVHAVRCSSEVYSSPLYPVLAADADAMILVNLGQAQFKYEPANAGRTKNPSFIRISSGGRPLSGSIDSGELAGSKNKEQNYYSSSSKKSNGYLDDGIEAESDLFEISLQR